jgi:hypothetical protein
MTRRSQDRLPLSRSVALFDRIKVRCAKLTGDARFGVRDLGSASALTRRCSSISRSKRRQIHRTIA